MKKIIYLIGAFVTTAAIIGAIAVMLNKLKISLSIEGIDDSMDTDEDDGHIDLSIEKDADEAKAPVIEVEADDTAESVENAINEMLEQEDATDIDVEITEE